MLALWKPKFAAQTSEMACMPYPPFRACGADRP
jgi:hypothetical protein